MRNYEGVFIVNPDLAPEAAKGVVTSVQEVLAKNGGRVEGLQDWGKKRLAFKIKKKQEGTYYLLNYQLDPKNEKKVEQTLRLNDQILRFLIINKDEA